MEHMYVSEECGHSLWVVKHQWRVRSEKMV